MTCWSCLWMLGPCGLGSLPAVQRTTVSTSWAQSISAWWQQYPKAGWTSNVMQTRSGAVAWAQTDGQNAWKKRLRNAAPASVFLRKNSRNGVPPCSVTKYPCLLEILKNQALISHLLLHVGGTKVKAVKFSVFDSTSWDNFYGSTVASGGQISLGNTG